MIRNKLCHNESPQIVSFKFIKQPQTYKPCESKNLKSYIFAINTAKTKNSIVPFQPPYNKKLIFFLILFLTTINIKAQDEKHIPLQQVLQSIEKKFDVLFSYANENISDITIKIPKDIQNLDQWILELEKQTNLRFTQLNKRYIAIQKINKDILFKGTIIDRTSNKTVSGAFIYSSLNHTVSNDKGQFSLFLNRIDSFIIIQHTGYKTLTLKSNNAYHHFSDSIKLTPNNFLIKEVVINYIAQGIDKLKDGSFQLQIQNLETLPGLTEPDILLSIQTLPGIQSIGECASDINMRGGTNDQNLVLWDGIKMYQTGHFFGLISAFNSHLIYKTNIIKNGTPASLNDGVSGTIDLKLQNFGVKKMQFEAGLNMICGDIITKTPIAKNTTLILGFRNSINKIIQTPTYKSYYKRAFYDTQVLNDSNNISTGKDFSFYDITAKLIYCPSNKDKVNISLLNINNKISYHENYIYQSITYNNSNNLNQNSLLTNIVYSRQWNKKNKTKFSAYISNYHLRGNSIKEENNQNHNQENAVKDWGIKMNWMNKFRQSVIINSGYQFNEIGIRNLDNIQQPNYYRDAKDVLRIHALFSEIEFENILPELYTRFGLRTNYLSNFQKLLLEPRLALNYKINNSLSVEVLTELKSQYTTQQIDYQSDFMGIEKRRWVLSNDESVPLLKSTQYSVGTQYHKGTILLSLETYKKKVNGIISPSQGFLNQYQYTYSTGSYHANGIEFLANKYFMNSNIWFNYTFAKNNYFFSAFTPSTFPNNLDVRHYISIGGNYSYKKFNFSCGMNYRTGIPYTKITDNNSNDNVDINYKKANSSRINNYLQFDMSAKYHFEVKNIKAELGASIWNIFNRENVIKIYYQRNNNNEIEQIKRYGLGITPNLNARISF